MSLLWKTSPVLYIATEFLLKCYSTVGYTLITPGLTNLNCKISRLPFRVKSSCEWCAHTRQVNCRIHWYDLPNSWDIKFQRAIRAIYTIAAELVKACFSRKAKTFNNNEKCMWSVACCMFYMINWNGIINIYQKF